MSGICFTLWGIQRLLLCSSRERLWSRPFRNQSAVSGTPMLDACSSGLGVLQEMSLVTWDGEALGSMLATPWQRACVPVSLFSRVTSLHCPAHAHWAACVSSLEIPGENDISPSLGVGCGCFAQSSWTRGLRWQVLQGQFCLLPAGCCLRGLRSSR